MLLLLILFLLPLSLLAAPNENEIVKILKKTPKAELPAKAAEIVKKASVEERNATAVTVVRAAGGLNPAVTKSVVNSVVLAAPETKEAVAKSGRIIDSGESDDDEVRDYAGPGHTKERGKDHEKRKDKDREKDKGKDREKDKGKGHEKDKGEGGDKDKGKGHKKEP